MSVQVLADTHALIWYLFDEERLSPAGRVALDGAIEAGFPILVSAISIIEVVYLEEKHKISAGTAERIRQACETEDPSLEIVPVDARVAYGIHEIARADVPDMPDSSYRRDRCCPRRATCHSRRKNLRVRSAHHSGLS